MAQARSAAARASAKRPAFCGQPVTDGEWDVVRDIVEGCRLSRHELASTICEALGWVRPNGRLKSRECYEYLNLLEAKGLVTLPARREQRPRGGRRASATPRRGASGHGARESCRTWVR